MSMTQEALKELLEAVEQAIQVGDWKVDGACDPDLAIRRAKQALAQPEQEPVAIVDANDDGYWADILPNRSVKVGQMLYTTPPQRTEQEPVAHWSDCAVHSEPAYPKGECDCGGIVAVADYTALSDKYVALSDKYVALSDKYVALKAQRTWVGLTTDEIAVLHANYPNPQGFALALQAKLKEKNNA